MEAVSYTAQWTAAARALETERDDALFRDPYARAVAGDTGFQLLERYASPVTVEYLALRTAYLDRVLIDSLEAHEIEQVVLVAAGMDTRPYRLDWGRKVSVFELDRAALLDVKEEMLADAELSPGLSRTTVGVDLAGSWESALREAGFSTEGRTLWIVEGLLYYLKEDSARGLLATLAHLSGPGALVAGDLISTAALNNPVARPFIKALEEDGAPWLFGTDTPEELLEACGWRVEEVKQPGEEGSGRWPYHVLPRHVTDVPRNFLFTAALI
ncbi:SAM-dependent methyltransferase [Streptomyces coelicoflavus]|uniref:S-adenosyl-L-methionine-dependent methyltransferase n=1 Tax=Streptomyces coelicoflavus TaxID=285562 RepID=A0A7K3PMS5_9ACTN|nr:SAM-dependent methyltransferase [Streptomyces coelicoflavus]NEB11256.1 SAM-dependent methyltransferase [Streptomyces coelicoflavus]